MSVLNKIAPISQNRPPLRCSLYGPSGAGKSVLAATAPRPLVLDCEQGAESLLNHSWSKDTPVYNVDTSADITDLIWEFRAKPAELTDNYETLVVDTATELSAKDLSNTLVVKNAKDESRNPYNSQQIDYKENTERLRRIFIALFDLPVNVILISHATEMKDESDGRIYIRPALSPKLAQTVKGLVGVQAYLKANTERDGTVTRTLQLQPGNQIDAKCRIGGLPSILSGSELTFETILKARVASIEDEEGSNNE